MLLRDSKRGPFLGCSSFPKCRSTKMARKLPPDQLEYLNTLLPELRKRVEESHRLVAKMTGKPADSFGPLPRDHLEPEEEKPAPKKKAAKKTTRKKTVKKDGVTLVLLLPAEREDSRRSRGASFQLAIF